MLIANNNNKIMIKLAEPKKTHAVKSVSVKSIQCGVQSCD